MLTNKEIEAMTDEQRSAWLDGMTPDEKLVVYTPPGYLSTLVIVAYTKRALVSYEIPIGERLRMLETINGFVDTAFTAEALAVIEPACHTAMEMIHECLQVDEGKPRLGKAFDLMASWEVFGHLLKLNPSMLAAIKLFPAHGAPAAKSTTN
jgi:hypothetical protein